MMEKISISNSWGNLPEKIHNQIDLANVFYTRDFEHYLSLNNEVIYIYDNAYLQIVAVHKLFCFKYAFFPSEPFQYVGVPDSKDEGAFMDKVILFLKKLKISWTSITPASSCFLSYPTNSIRIPWGNYVINLDATEEELFAKITSKHRNMIRRGMKSEIEIKYGGIELLDDYLIVDAQTWDRSGVTYSKASVYKKYLDNLPHNTIIGVAYKDSIPQCGLIGLYNRACFYYEFGASANHPEPGSTHYLQWETILKMKRLGVKKYSFVGCRIDVDKNSKLSNIQHFKSGFGGDLKESFMFKCNLNSFYVYCFKMLLFFKTRRFPKDAIDTEKSKWVQLNKYK